MMLNRQIPFLIFFLTCLQLSAEDLTVCHTCTYKSIKAAVNKAVDGDVIYVQKGLYREHGIVIDKSVKLVGQAGAVIDGENLGEIISVMADDVVIEGLTIQNVGTSYTEDRAGIRIRKSRKSRPTSCA